MSDDAKFELKSTPNDSQARLPLPSGEGQDEGEASQRVGNGKTARRKKDSVRLVWDSKPKRPPSPRDIEFQTAEIVIPNPARDADSLPYSFRDGQLNNEGPDRAQMNRLIWGDNLLAMQALIASGYEGKIDLIYIDPPFDSGADYSQPLAIGNGEVVREPSVLERLAYTDTWQNGLDSYLDMMYPRVQLMRRLLSDRGVLYVHLDWHCGHYMKIVLDEAFGPNRFINEIVWRRANTKKSSVRFGVLHDVLYIYSKTDSYTYNPQFTELEAEYISTKFPHTEPDGRRYQLQPLHGKGQGGPKRFGKRLLEPPPGRHWSWSQTNIDDAIKKGIVVFSEKGNPPRYKDYLDGKDGIPVCTIWNDIPDVNSQAEERTSFDTQKPEALLERIITASSNDGDTVADFFCGSGTTLAVAENLGRRWIGCDFGKVGIQVSRARLVEMDAKPFLLENIGNYQREMIYLTGGRIGEMQRIILKLYGATPHPQQRDLGTRQAPGANGNGEKRSELELVYVGYPDRPTTAKKVEELARLADSLDGKGYKKLVILAWDYDYNFDQDWEARQKTTKTKLKVEVERRLIPPDVYDYLRKAKNEADLEKLADKIKFHEKPYLKLAKPKVKLDKKSGKSEVTVSINRYVIWDLPVPEKDREKLRELIKDNFAVLIDYWAVDWNYDGATFRSQWQAIRGNGKRATVVTTEASHAMKVKKNHKIAVRVVDIFGNDAAAVLEVE